VITKKDKEKIDQNHPGSYDHSLEYGTTDKKYIYICPKFWCINCETSLTEEEVKAKISEAESFAEEDKMRKEKVEMRNMADQI
ncbi:MAG TPA: hypothetical protein D7H86_00620, partial [Candidatus Poseidoniales archaeon]